MRKAFFYLAFIFSLQFLQFAGSSAFCQVLPDFIFSSAGNRLENRLVPIVVGAGLASARYDYTYDALGRRIRAIENGVTADYLYDSMSAISETNADGVTAYTRNPYAEGGIGGIVSMIKPNGKVFYYHYDAQGNVVGLTNEKGKSVSEYGYEAFGRVTEKEGSFKGNPYRFSTKEHGPDNLYYYGARYYDPQAGRWPRRSTG